MTQVYSVPSREDDPHSLPDVEVFYRGVADYCYCDFCGSHYSTEESPDLCAKSLAASRDETDDDYPTCEYCGKGNVLPMDAGWYYWHCFPGCLPDGAPIGPFDSEQAAIDDAQEDAWQFEDDDDDAEADND